MTDETITLTNPENYPSSEIFREAVVATAEHCFVHMDEMGSPAARARFVKRLIETAEVAIAVLKPSPEVYTFFTVKGSNVLATMMMNDKTVLDVMMTAFPVFNLEYAAELRRTVGDSAGLQ